MAININKASIKQLTTLPGIGTKFAETIVSLRSKKGYVIIDDFHDTPTLQTKLHELHEKGLILIEYSADLSSDKGSNGSDQETKPKYSKEPMDPITLLANQIGELGKIMQANTLAITGAINELKIQSGNSEYRLTNLIQGNKIPKDAMPQLKIPASQLDTKPITSTIQAPDSDNAPMQPTGDPIIDATLKTIEDKAPPLPPHILNVTHAMASGEQKEPSNSTTTQAKKKPIVASGIPDPPHVQSPHQNTVGQTGQNIGTSVTPSPQLQPLIASAATARPTIPKLAPYNGSTDFYAFATKFDTIADCCKWNDEIKLIQLVGALTGKALEVYAWQEPSIRQSYNRSRDQLLKMFGKRKDPIIYRAELTSIRQTEDETLEEFGQRVRQTATRAYPTASTEVFETLAREAFLKGCCNAEAAELALFRDPQTLNDAVQYTQTAAHNHRLLARQGRSRMRHVSFNDQSPVNEKPSVRQVQVNQAGKDKVDIHLDWSEMNSNIRELISCLKETKVKPVDSPPQPTTLISNRPNRYLSPRRGWSPNRGSSPPASPTRQRCFHCNEVGHWARDCPNKNSSLTSSPVRKVQGSLNR